MPEKKLPFETNKQKYLVAFTYDKNKLQSSTNECSHSQRQLAVSYFFDFDTSNEYLSIDEFRTEKGFSENCSCPRNHQVVEWLKLTSFQSSSTAKSKALNMAFF